MAVEWNSLIALWTQPLPEGEAAVAAFGKVYADPVSINGVATSLAALVERARATQKTFADLQATLLTQVDAGSHTAVVFRMRGRHVGPMATPLGEIAATGQIVERQIIDVLGTKSGLIDQVWMVSDDLGALARLGALALKGDGGPAAPRR
jgi:SnoaL-like polyketide cyclase